MKRILVLAISVITFSCIHDNKEVESNENSSIDETKSISYLDSIVTGNYTLMFHDAKPFDRTDIYGDLDKRDSLTENFSNWHKKAFKIQEYLEENYDYHFSSTDSSVSLSLEDGRNLIFKEWDKDEEKGFNVEHFFDDINYFLLYVSYPEGNSWVMVNRKNGFTKEICGTPYISPSKKKILTANTDLEAGYSFNGIEYYSINKDSLKLEFRIGTSWGPNDIKWLNDSSFLIQREHFHVNSENRIQENKIDFKKVTLTFQVDTSPKTP